MSWFSLEVGGFAATEAARLRTQRHRDNPPVTSAIVKYAAEPKISMVDLLGRLDDRGRAQALVALRGLVADLVEYCVTDTSDANIGKAKAELIERMSKVVGFDADDAHGMVVSRS